MEFGFARAVFRSMKTRASVSSTTSARTSDRYTNTAIILHWTIAVLVILGLGTGIYGSELEDSTGETLINLHKLLGLSTLALTVVRIGWRLGHRPPPLPSTISKPLRYAAHTVHALFYVLLLALPLSGWLMTSAFPGRHPIELGTAITIPFLPVSPDLVLATTAFRFHETGAWLMISLLALHLGGALKHRFTKTARLLDRMLPRSGARSTEQ